MKLISVNIQNNFHNQVIVDFLKKEKPDVVCFQELLEEDLAFFRNKLSMESTSYFADYVREEDYPGLGGKRCGVAIFARKIVDCGYIFYAGNEKNSKKSFQKWTIEGDYQKNKALVWALIEIGVGKSFKCITSHLPWTPEGKTTPEQITAVEVMLQKLKDLGEFIFAGDMNALRGKEAFSKIAEKYKDNIPEEYKTSLDQNLHKVKGLQNMVDGLFTTPTYKASNVKLVDGLSDHMAIVAEITKN